MNSPEGGTQEVYWTVRGGQEWGTENRTKCRLTRIFEKVEAGRERAVALDIYTQEEEVPISLPSTCETTKIVAQNTGPGLTRPTALAEWYTVVHSPGLPAQSGACLSGWPGRM
ncbi:hypothetical protein RRG08_039748 [Elysia crispata]|uniref:Uncharacterized protein n=1 Tax=Elysia crispata TaxID=231223 RepID=A0AAE1CV04_9GAST|nr:hypothetical protein RRG08_039748 [Elysia crispata]